MLLTKISRFTILGLAMLLGMVSRGFAPQGVFTPIDVPGASVTEAFGINPEGDIVGFYEAGPPPFVGHGFLLSKGVFTPSNVPFPGTFSTQAQEINPEANEGDIVGRYADATGTHGFLLSKGVFTPINVPGASLTEANGINPQGVIVGSYDETGLHGFLLSKGVFTPIDVPGASGTGASGINPQATSWGPTMTPRPVRPPWVSAEQGRIHPHRRPRRFPHRGPRDQPTRRHRGVLR